MDANPKRRHKFGAVRTQVGDMVFPSKKEAARYVLLCLEEQTGQISNLECQPEYEIVVNGIKVGKYLADFRYIRDGVTVIEDVKSAGTKTPVYRLKKRLVEALFGIRIVET